MGGLVALLQKKGSIVEDFFPEYVLLPNFREIKVPHEKVFSKDLFHQ